MEYMRCGPPTNPSCSNPERESFGPGTCVEGCACKDGLVMEGDKCIEPEKCGCILEGLYYPVSKRFSVHASRLSLSTAAS